MDKLCIEGGHPLSGTVSIGGAKNAALPALAATLLTDDSVHLENVPEVRDVTTICHLLEHLGVHLERIPGGGIRTRGNNLGDADAPYDLVKTMRASFLVLGPLLARVGRARVSLPGGCAIGARPVDRHLMALSQLGVELRVERGYVEASCRRLRGAEIAFEAPTVGGTENMMMAATLAEGTTVLRNAAREPEITDLAQLLTAMGSRIEGAGTDTVTIHGATRLYGASYRMIPDRIEAGTYVIAGALLGNPLEIIGCDVSHLRALLDKLREVGVQIETTTDTVLVSPGKARSSANVHTQPFPGFPTDMQAQYMVLMTQARGSSLIRESIFENRFMHVPELSRMGADIAIDGHTAVVRGPTPLGSAKVMATDLRASASLVLAALTAHGESMVDRVYHLDRGYEHLETKLTGAGAMVTRVRE